MYAKHRPCSPDASVLATPPRTGLGEKNAWFARAILLAILCGIAIFAHLLDVGWLRR
jgi:hypothetical protein